MRYKPVVGLLAFTASLASCTLFKTSCKQNSMGQYAEPDSSAVIYSDSIDAVILNANRVRLYDMTDFVREDSAVGKRDSIFNYEIKKDVGLLKKEELSILRFIISDKSWYIKDYAPVRQPFHPNIALEFSRKKSKTFMLVSFGTEEIAIAMSDGKFNFYLMRDKRALARWAAQMFPEDNYYKILLSH